MKKIVFILLISLNTLAQNINVTQVKYKFIRALVDESLMKKQEKCREYLKTEYALFSFNTQFAKYENLGDPRLFNDINYFAAQLDLGYTLIYNLKEKTTFKFELNSHYDFYFKYDTQNHLWNLKNETKTINNITCYKATLDYQTFTYNQNNERVPMIITYEAWYAPSIPIKVFYKELNGLPGLILELKRENYGSLVAEYINYNVNVYNNLFEPEKGFYQRTDYEEYKLESIKFSQLLNKL